MNLLSQAAAVLPSSHAVGEAIVVAALAVKQYLDHSKGSKRDSNSNRQFSELRKEVKQVGEKVDEVDRAVVDLRAELRGRDKGRDEARRDHLRGG